MRRIAMYLATAAFGSALLTVGGAAWAGPGNYCATPTKTCVLPHGRAIGKGCSCGRERGTVTTGEGYSADAYYRMYGHTFKNR